MDGCSYYFGKTLNQYFRWADEEDEDVEEKLETHKKVLKDTDGAISMACSGPTTVDAATTFTKLCFKCQGPTCKAQILN